MVPMPAAYEEARRTEILDAALRVFVRAGVNAATMQEIARETGLSVGALYRYFESKDALVQGVMQACYAENEAFFARADAHAAPAGASPVERLRASGQLAWAMFDEPDARERAVIALEGTLAAARDGSDPIAEYARQGPRNVIGGLAAWVDAAQEAGELDPALSPRHLATLLYACHLGTRDLMVLFDDREVDAGGVLQALLALVGAAATKGPRG